MKTFYIVMWIHCGDMGFHSELFTEYGEAAKLVAKWQTETPSARFEINKVYHYGK